MKRKHEVLALLLFRKHWLPIYALYMVFRIPGGGRKRFAVCWFSPAEDSLVLGCYVYIIWDSICAVLEEEAGNLGGGKSSRLIWWKAAMKRCGGNADGKLVLAELLYVCLCIEGFATSMIVPRIWAFESVYKLYADGEWRVSWYHCVLNVKDK